MMTVPHRPAVIEGDIAKLPLGADAKDGYAVVDKEYAFLDRYSWIKTNQGYAAARINNYQQLLHRYIMNPLELTVDHINSDRLDCRVANMRNCTIGQNSLNKPVQARKKSGYKGVEWAPTSNKWRAVIRLNGKRYHLGVFTNIEDAAEAYKHKAAELHGEYARV